MTDVINGVPRELRSVLSMILSALDRDAAEGKTVRGEMAEELRALLATAQLAADGERGEHGDAYQGAREDLAIWKRRALEAESKVREQDRIIENLGNALNDENGPTFMGEPVLQARAAQPQQAVAVTDAMVLAARGVCVSFRGHYGEHNDYLDDCTARQIIEAALSAHKTGEEE